MPRDLGSIIDLDSLKKEARRWLNALRSKDAAASRRLTQAWPGAPETPTLRHVQHALAREFGLANWATLKQALAGRTQSTQSEDPETALSSLLLAAGEGDLARVTDILDRFPDLVSRRGTLPGHTGLRSALHFGVSHEPVVRLLLERGADPNVRDDGDNACAMHFAAEKQDLAVVRLLVEHGGDPIGAGDLHELEVIGWATGFDYVNTDPALVHYLLTHGARHNIFSAVSTGDEAAIRELIAASPAALERHMDGTNHRRTALHLAVVKRQRDALNTLLELGANLETTDAAGLTALDCAALTGRSELAQILLAHGARVHLPAAVALERTADIERLAAEEPGTLAPGQRWGALVVRASEHASGSVVETLLALGASPDAVDDVRTAIDGVGGYTALHAAAWTGNLEAIEVLLRHGANPRVRDDKYCAPAAGWADYAGKTEARDRILQADVDIFQAIAYERLDLVDRILARDPGALERPLGHYKPCEPDDHWHTPLSAAVANNAVPIVSELLTRGASVVGLPDGRSLAAFAGEKGFAVVAALLNGEERS